MKKSKKFNNIIIFPILFLVFPFLYFLLLSLIRYINTGNFNYLNNFTYLFNALKDVNEYLFPTVIFLTIGLFTILINKTFNKKIIKPMVWIIIILSGILIILFGNRLIFIAINNYWNTNIILFLTHSVNHYTFLISCELTFFICFILHYFDIKYLKRIKTVAKNKK